MSDAEDASRYRWLKAQFEREIEHNEFTEYLGTNSRGQEVYEKRENWFYIFKLKNDWMFGDTVKSQAAMRDFDEIVDELRASVQVTGQ